MKFTGKGRMRYLGINPETGGRLEIWQEGHAWALGAPIGERLAEACNNGNIVEQRNAAGVLARIPELQREAPLRRKAA